MANSSLSLSSVDFDGLKQNFKTFLQTQSVFKDYNFDGSNINVLLDVLSYNSYLNSFYLNMVASEMFLDSAQKYDSVVSHGKELNYLPRSYRSSAVNVTVNFETVGVANNLTVQKGTRFSGTNSNGSFTFTTDETIVYVSPNSNFVAANLTIYEGSYFQDNYAVNYDDERQQFIISNKNVDTNSLTVTVIENNGANTTIYTRAETLFGLNSNSTVYFLQGAQNNQYEVVFGDNLFGKKPLNNSIVNLNYRVSQGTDANGITDLSLIDDLSSINAGDVSVQSLVINEESNSGANQESIDSIKFSAPRYFATQQRAVSSEDYASLLLSNFGSEISDIIVYGGETVEPKLYGRVILAIKPSSGLILPNFLKEKINTFLSNYIALPNRIVISNPEYLYCYVNSKISYDPSIATKSILEIRSDAVNTIFNYGNLNLGKFGKDLRYSKLTTAIDNSDPSIVSNDTELRIVKRISPQFNTSTDYEIDTDNTIYYDSFNFNTIEQHSLLHDSSKGVLIDHAGLISSTFTYNAKNGQSYPLSFLEDDSSTIDKDGNADVKVYYLKDSRLFSVETVGKINYLTGKLSLYRFNVSSYDNYISIYFRPKDKDIIADKNKILLIDPVDISIEVTEYKR
jgi:hypothetical protein